MPAIATIVNPRFLLLASTEIIGALAGSQLDLGMLPADLPVDH